MRPNVSSICTENKLVHDTQMENCVLEIVCNSKVRCNLKKNM